jgi:hypothetical protein
MKKLFTLLLISVFTISMAAAQTKKAAKKPVPSKSTAPASAKPASAGGKTEAAPSMKLETNDIAAPNAKKMPPFRAGTFGDSIAKFIPTLQGREEAFDSPYIVVAPPAADENNYTLFLKLAKASSLAKGVQNRIINSRDEKEWVAVAFNNPASLLELSTRKELLFLKTYCFASLKALEESSDPYAAYLRNEKSLVKLINLQNINYLPVNSEIKESNSQLAP